MPEYNRQGHSTFGSADEIRLWEVPEDNRQYEANNSCPK